MNVLKYQPEHNCFRKDLIITSLKQQEESERIFFIKDPNSDDTFEFGEEEYFLYRSMDGKLTPSQIIAAFHDKYQLQLTQEDFADFANSIFNYGLLQSYQPMELEIITENIAIKTGSIASELKLNQGTSLSQSASHNTSKITKKAKTEKSGLVICKPREFLKICAKILSPFSVLVWLIFPGVILAFFTVIHNQFYLWDSFLILWGKTNPLLSLTISLATVNFISVISQGLVYSYYGGTVATLKIKLTLGIFPLFYVNLQEIKRLNRKNQLWVFATPLLTRISIFSLGILIWKMTYTNQNSLGTIVLFLVQSSIIGLIVDSSPFWYSNGYRWFSLYFYFPRIFEKTLRVWDMMLNRRPFPKTLSLKEKLSLQIYACILVLSWGILFICLSGITAILLEQRFQGAGVIIFLILIALILRSYLVMNSKKNNPQSQISENLNNSSVIMDINNDHRSFNQKKFIKFLNKNRFQIISLIGIIVILFLPYRYRPGGSIELLPPKQQNIQADISGKITKVFFPGGDDTWVKKGQIIATTMASRQLNPATPIDSDVLIIQEQIKNQKAVIETKQAQLDKLLSTPRQEDINIAKTELQTAKEKLIASQHKFEISQKELEVAKNNLMIAQAQVDVAIKSYETTEIQAGFRTSEALRNKELLDDGVVSLQTYEDKQILAEAGRSDMEKAQQVIQVTHQDVAKEQQNVQVAVQKVQEQKQNILISKSQVEEKIANLQLVLIGPNSNEITAARKEVEAAKATLQATQQQLLSVQSQLQGKNLFMPFDGYIVTPFLAQKVNTYLEQGTTFAVAEDNRNIQGQVNVSETDIGLFNIGQEVEIKLAAYPNLSLIGKIISIEPATGENDKELGQGRFVQVIVELPNSQKLLKSGMSGYAKFEGITMPVIEAFTRPMVRFFQIEIWSWFP